MKMADDNRQHKMLLDTKSEQDRRRRLQAGVPVGAAYDTASGRVSPLSVQLNYAYCGLSEMVSALPDKFSRSLADELVTFGESVKALESHPGIDSLDDDDESLVLRTIADWSGAVAGIHAERRFRKSVPDADDAATLAEVLNDWTAEADAILTELNDRE